MNKRRIVGYLAIILLAYGFLSIDSAKSLEKAVDLSFLDANTIVTMKAAPDSTVDRDTARRGTAADAQQIVNYLQDFQLKPQVWQSLMVDKLKDRPHFLIAFYNPQAQNPEVPVVSFLVQGDKNMSITVHNASGMGARDNYKIQRDKLDITKLQAIYEGMEALADAQDVLQ